MLHHLLAAPNPRLLLGAVGLLSAFTLAGCSTSPQSPRTSVHTLRDVPGLPYDLVARAFKPNEWQRWESLHCTGYVILRGKIGQGGTLSNLRVTTCQPDRSRNALAIEFCDALRVSAVTIGSKVPPTANVYVVFFETPPVRTALVYGETNGTVDNIKTNRFPQDVLIKYY